MGTHDMGVARIRTSRLGGFMTILAVCAMSTASAGTIVVGAAPPVPGTVTATTLQQAVNIAADGDTILVMAGSYAGITNLPANKRLTIVGAGVAVTSIQSLRSFSLFPLFANPVRDVTVRGITIHAHSQGGIPGPTWTPALVLDQGDDSLLFEDCRFLSSCATPGAVVKNARKVSFVRCEFVGAGGCEGPCFSCVWPDGSPGLLAFATDGSIGPITLVDCDLSGGNGLAFTLDPDSSGGNGGSGLHASNVIVTAIGSQFVGGNTGPKPPSFPGTSYTAGAGARIDNGVLRHQDCDFVSGIISDRGAGTIPPAIWTTGSGVEASVSGTTARLTTAAKSTVGQSTTIDVEGVPGSFALLMLGTALPFTHVPGYLAPLGLVPPPLLIPLGTLPPSGIFSFTSTVPSLPVGVPSVSLGIQAATSGIGANALSNTSVATLVVAGL